MDLSAREESVRTIWQGCFSEVLARIHQFKSPSNMQEHKIHQNHKRGEQRGKTKHKILRQRFKGQLSLLPQDQLEQDLVL